MKPLPPPVFAVHCVGGRLFAIAPVHRPHDHVVFDRTELRIAQFSPATASTTAPIIDAGAPDAPLRVTACRMDFDRDAVLQAKAQRHRGVSCDGLDVTAGLAAVDEDFARRAVGIETDGDRERLVPEPQVEGFAARR